MFNKTFILEKKMKILNKVKLASAIESRAKEDLALCNIDGASVLVWQSGEVIYINHFGAASLDGKTLSDNTLFRMASMTKPISAVAAMILVDRGLLSLSDTVDKYYPEFSKMRVFGTDETVDSITVEQLLTHTSGIGSGDAWAESLKVLHAEDKSSVESFRAFLSNQPLSFVPGTKQEYSGIGAFSVLTAIIQKISGMTYAEFLKKEIFEPCKMINTTFSPSAEQWQKLIEMHSKRADKNAIGKTWDGCVFEAFPPESYLGGAGLISSIADYLNFTKMLVSRGEFEGKRIISEAAVSELSKPRFNINDVEWWGLGVRVITGDTGSPIPLGAYGWSGAYGTHFWVDTENEIIGIYMKNSRYDGGSGAVTSKNFEIDVYSALE